MERKEKVCELSRPERLRRSRSAQPEGVPGPSENFPLSEAHVGSEFQLEFSFSLRNSDFCFLFAAMKATNASCSYVELERSVS